MIRKTWFKAAATGVMTIAVERETVLNSEYSRDSWGFTAKEQREGVGGWKSTKRVGGILLKAGPSMIMHEELAWASGVGEWVSRILCWAWAKQAKNRMGARTEAFSRRWLLKAWLNCGQGESWPSLSTAGPWRVAINRKDKVIKYQ